MIRIATHSLASTLVLASIAGAQDPFAAGTRWSFDATAKAPWVPESVSFAARENLVLLGAGGATPTLAALDRAAFGDHSPRYSDSSLVAGASHITTVSGWNEDLFTAFQVPTPDLSHRASFVARHDLAAAARGAGFVPAWVHDTGLISNGPLRLAADLAGDTVVLAAWDNMNSTVQLDWLDGETGTLVNRVLQPAAALNSIAISEDGGVVVVAAGLDLYLFDGVGTLLQHELLSSATKTISLSGDGSTLAVGGIGQLAILTEGPAGTWSNTFNAFAPTSEIAASADLSRDGDILGVAWWNYANGVDVRFDIWDLVRVKRVTSLPLHGDPKGHQNLPAKVDVTPDGAHVAFGTWGNGVWPEVFVMRTGEDLPLYAVDTPGSVRDLDITDNGNRVLVAYKSTHNNVFSNKGGVLLYEDGSQTISQLAPAATGEDLDIATYLDGAGVTFLLIGHRAAPVQFPGVTGELLLDRTSLQVLLKGAPGGRSDFAMPVPDDASLLGTQYSMQPAWRAAGGTVLGPEVIDPMVFED